MTYGNVKPPFGAQIKLGHPLSQGLVGCWIFNENSGNKAYDSSGQKNTGTLMGMADPPTSVSGWNAGIHGGALAFDGINGHYVTVPNHSLFNFSSSSFSIISCLYRAVMGVQHAIVEKYISTYGWSLRIQSNDVLALGLYNGSWTTYSSAGTIPALAWTTVAGTFDSNTVKYSLFINGKPDRLSLNANAPGNDTGPVEIGKRGNDGNYCFNGTMSHIMIYNRALSAQEISYLYSQPYAMFEPELVNIDYLFNPPLITGWQ